MSDTKSRVPRVFTIGHSDIPIENFMGLLEQSSVRLVADVRSNPASVRHPWFERHALARELEKRGLAYRWFRALGGRRPNHPNQTIHTALKEDGDRAYAHWMNSADFHEACKEVVGLAASTVSVLMCAERDPEHCHRKLVADKLMRMGIRVTHILGSDDAVDHVPHPGLEVDEDGKLVYRKKQLSLI